MSSLSKDTEIINELRSSCSPKVNEMLFNFVGPADLDNAGEQELMKHIKAVAVRVVHPEVYRQQFFTLKQSDGESTTNFVSRLKAQAMLCDFTCQNQTCTTAYSPDMVKSQLIAGTHEGNLVYLYTCENVKGMYLSQTALKKMNIIHKDFPATPKSVSNIATTFNNPDNALNKTSPNVKLAPCGCPLRQPSPALPEKIPFPATNEYRQQIQN